MTVAIKPLVWVPRYTEPVAPQVWNASVGPVLFVVVEMRRPATFCLISPFAETISYPTADAARAAAQEQWEAFVLAAIES